MLSRKELFHTMQSSEQRFELLRNQFRQFCTCLAEETALQDCSVKGITVFTDALDKNYFDVLFVGGALALRSRRTV